MRLRLESVDHLVEKAGLVGLQFGGLGDQAALGEVAEVGELVVEVRGEELGRDGQLAVVALVQLLLEVLVDFGLEQVA